MLLVRAQLSSSSHRGGAEGRKTRKSTFFDFGPFWPHGLAHGKSMKSDRKNFENPKIFCAPKHRIEARKVVGGVCGGLWGLLENFDFFEFWPPKVHVWDHGNFGWVGACKPENCDFGRLAPRRCGVLAA